MGAVEEPGTYALKKGANSVVELIGEAGGLTELAGNFLHFIPAELSGMSGANSVEARARLSLASERLVGRADSGIEIPVDSVLGTGGGIPLDILPQQPHPATQHHVDFP